MTFSGCGHLLSADVFEQRTFSRSGRLHRDSTDAITKWTSSEGGHRRRVVADTNAWSLPDASDFQELSNSLNTGPGPMWMLNEGTPAQLVSVW